MIWLRNHGGDSPLPRERNNLRERKYLHELSARLQQFFYNR